MVNPYLSYKGNLFAKKDDRDADKDCGESKRSLVMREIKRISLTRKWAHFHKVLYYEKLETLKLQRQSV